MSTTAAQARAQRQDLINRAVAYMDAADPADLSRLLAGYGARPAHQDNPRLLRDAMAAATPDGPGGLFPAYKAAQRLLHAAGLYQYPS